MRRDASSLPPDAELEADVAVVGAGPLGIVIALELARKGFRVLLAESGRHGVDEAAQALSATPGGDDVWHARKDLAVRRQVGGTSTLWGGRCVPFDPIDFEPRPIRPDVAWPVTHDEMVRYLQRACEWSVCGDAVFDVKQIPSLAARDLIAGLPDDGVKTTDLERWALPTRFGKVYGGEIDDSPLLDLITGLTCTEVVCVPDGTAVDRLEFRSAGGARASARAERFVLAPGGLEATRLLLASNAVHKDGIGNHSHHLGHWYMAHVEGRVARIHIDRPPEQTIHDHERAPDGAYVRRRFTFAAEYQHEHALPNAAIWFVNPELGDPAHGSGILSGVYLTLISPLGKYLLAEAIRQAGTKTSSPVSLRSHVKNIVRDIVPAARFAATFTWERFLRPGRKAPGFFVRSAANVYPLHYHGEHLPRYESRVELGEERDAFGVPRLRTCLSFSDEDISGVRRALEHLDRHLRKHGVGHLEFASDVDASVREYLVGTAGYHQTGTTRMSQAPEDGVVTPQLAIHGVSNLFVNSTSVLPTSSQANPTLTGIAFAVRLADHLEKGLAPRR